MRNSLLNKRVVQLKGCGSLLIDEDNSDYDNLPEMESISNATLDNVTPQMLADDLDQDAENANYHDIVGKHSRLASILEEFCTPKIAMKVMLKLWEEGGFVP